MDRCLELTIPRRVLQQIPTTIYCDTSKPVFEVFALVKTFKVRECLQKRLLGSVLYQCNVAERDPHSQSEKIIRVTLDQQPKVMASTFQSRPYDLGVSLHYTSLGSAFCVLS